MIIRKSVVLPAPFGPMMPTMPDRGKAKSTFSKSSLSPNALVSFLAMTTSSPRRGAGGMRISWPATSAFASSSTSASYAPRRALLLAWRALGLIRTHSSSRSSVRFRAEACFSSVASFFSFWSSQDE